MTYTTEYRRILHRMGYYNYQDGLIHRHLGQEGGWDEHLERCRDYILRAVTAMKPAKVTVLGSGWLLDLPLAEMLEKTGRIVLADIVHPPEVIKQLSSLENVELAETDVTGGLVRSLWQAVDSQPMFRKLRSLSGIEVPEYNPESDPGMIISLNILTQLENLPAAFLRHEARICNEEMENFRKEIQVKHLSFLSKYPSVLISDVEEVFYGSNGSISVVPTLLAAIPRCSNSEEWTWGFDLKGSDFMTARSSMKVTAVTFRQ